MNHKIGCDHSMISSRAKITIWTLLISFIPFLFCALRVGFKCMTWT